MYKHLYSKFFSLYSRQAPATGIGFFRLLYGLVTLQEIIFLLYFNHLIFDPIPYIDVEFPLIPFFLCIWGIIAAFITVGYRYQFAVTCNYIFWIIFVNFTPIQRDFDGGFDSFMIGAGFFLLLMPGDKAFSIDNLRYKLCTPFVHYKAYAKPTVSILAYYLPILICLGFLYFDSAVHKMFAPHWRNGLGSWLPATQPYYVSALDMSWLLNKELLVKTIGYTILVFQFTFPFFVFKRNLRVVYLLIGIGLHLGITLTLNIYPFGLGMVVFYTLLVPFKCWRSLGKLLTAKQPSLTVFFDRDCPLCNRTVLILNHFDIFKCIDFKNAQDNAANYPALASLKQESLLADLYALDNKNRLYSGVDTYINIFLHMRYLIPVGLMMRLPGIYHFASTKYRTIADTRRRLSCTSECSSEITRLENNTLYQRIFERYANQKPKVFCAKLAKVFILLLLLQLNSTVHYGLIYRLNIDVKQNPITNTLAQASNSLLIISQAFLGIIPHALYLHDHFAGYDHILAITYIDDGTERWLPFVNEQGRLLAPNWGRVHSMWANIAVTPTIHNNRLKKFIMKVTAFWGHKIGLNLENTLFQIKMKKNSAPTYWVHDLLHSNLASQWLTIGTAKWHHNEIAINLPEDINAL